MTFELTDFVYGIILTVIAFTLLQQLSPENVGFKFLWEIPSEPRKKGSYLRSCFVAIVVYIILSIIISIIADFSYYGMIAIQVAMMVGFFYWLHVDRLVTLNSRDLVK